MKVQLSRLKASQTLVYFMLPSSLSDQAEAETSYEILSLVDLTLSSSVFSTPILVSSGNTSFINHLHLNPYFEVCFWETNLGQGVFVCMCACAHVLGQYKTFLNVIYGIRH